MRPTLRPICIQIGRIGRMFYCAQLFINYDIVSCLYTKKNFGIDKNFQNFQNFHICYTNDIKWSKCAPLCSPLCSPMGNMGNMFYSGPLFKYLEHLCNACVHARMHARLRACKHACVHASCVHFTLWSIPGSYHMLMHWFS